MSLRLVTVGLLAALGLAAAMGGPILAQAPGAFQTADDARAALESARRQQRSARARAARLEQRATQSRATAEQAVQRSAALAARVQQAEAGVAAAEARFVLATRERRSLDKDLAVRRAPLVRLTAALQSMARRPLALSALQAGSLRDLVYTRAVLASTIPLVRRRTAVLRGDLDRARALEAEARQALADRRDSEAALLERRKALATLAERERLKARQAAGGADREAQRALVLAEQAIDLDALVGQLEAAGSLRERLAALPGPIPRPADPRSAAVAAPPTPVPSSTAPPVEYQLPVAGTVVAGFGEAAASGQRQSGLALSVRAKAQVVSPGAGRIAFAGPYRGFGRIVIIEHPNGWTSLVTGLDSLDVAVGQMLTAGRRSASPGAAAIR